MWVHWWDDYNRVLVDGGKCRPGKRVRVRSEHHWSPPGGYAVFERKPKWLRGDKRFELRPETHLSVGSHQPGSSYCWSEQWELAAPRRDRAMSEYQAWPDSEDPRDPTVSAYIIRCGELFIERERRSLASDAVFNPSLHHRTGAMRVGAIGVGVGRDTVFQGSAPIDPPVEALLLQGVDLFRHLVQVARDFLVLDPAANIHEPFDVSSDTISYCGGSPFETPSAPVLADVAPNAPVSLRVWMGEADDTRSAFAVVVNNLETGVRSVSDPTFVTSIGRSVIVSDMPPDLLSAEASAALLAFARAGGNLAATASTMDAEPDVARQQIEQATEELGTDSVLDAAVLVGLSKRVSWAERAIAARDRMRGGVSL